MTKWEFQQIIQRDEAAQLRNTNPGKMVGEEWLEPLLEMEAETDRHALIIFCGELAAKLRKANEKNPN